MSEVDRIIENVEATMSMEDMSLLEEDRKRVRDCIEGKVSFQHAIDLLINKYTNKQVV